MHIIANETVQFYADYFNVKVIKLDGKLKKNRDLGDI